MNAVHAYPLTWPAGWPRDAHPATARFDTPLPHAAAALAYELGRMGATNVVISSNGELLRNGTFRANQPRLDDTGVAVYFELNGRQSCIPCDRWRRLQDNVQAVRLMVAALRGLERWGPPGVVTAAFTGFGALPAATSAAEDYWTLLDVAPDAPRSLIDAAYRRLARIHHPDAGGSEAAMQRLNAAYREAIRP